MNSFTRYIAPSPEARYRSRLRNMAATMEQVARADKPSISMGGTTTAPVPKCQRAKSGKDEAAHKKALVALGCMVCRRLYPWAALGEVELHHLRGGGWGRGDWTTLIPLCASHHRGDFGVHGLGTKGFPKHYGFDQADLLADALALAPIGEMG